MRQKCEELGLVYCDEGAGFPLLFIHGHPFNRTMWSPQIERFRTGFRCIAPDLPGYGDSPATLDRVRTQQQIAKELVTFLDHLEIASACVVGLSMGGQIAMELAAAFPRRVAGLVLAATFPQSETEAGVIERTRAADRMLAEGMVPIGIESLCKFFSRSTLKRNPMLAATVFRMICGVDPGGAAATVRGRALRRDYREPLAQIENPCLLICGTEDHYTSVADAEALGRSMRNARVQALFGIGHMPNLEDPERFNECLQSFLHTVVG